jgi:hypothetical protein
MKKELVKYTDQYKTYPLEWFKKHKVNPFVIVNSLTDDIITLADHAYFVTEAAAINSLSGYLAGLDKDYESQGQYFDVINAKDNYSIVELIGINNQQSFCTIGQAT